MAKPLLYSFWRSSCSWRVRIALHLKEIDYELVTVDIVKRKQQLSENYREVNPIQKVPALVINGHTLVESLNIMNYLEEHFPGTYPLYPSEDMDKSRARELSLMIVSGIQPLQNIGLKQIPMLADEKAFMKFSNFWINRGFVALEHVTKRTAGEYCVGNKVTIADVCLLPQIYNAKKFKIDLSPYPTLTRISEKLEREPSFFLTHPDVQPDCPPRKPTV